MSSSLLLKRVRYVAIATLTALAIVIPGLPLSGVSLSFQGAAVSASPLVSELSRSTTVAEALPPLPRPSRVEPIATPEPMAAPEPVADPAPVLGTDAGLPMDELPPVAIAPEPAPALPVIEQVNSRLGHFPYAEAEAARLQPVGEFAREAYSRTESLDFEAAEAFLSMRSAAAAQGVELMPISGFRSVTTQQTLFERQRQRKGSEAAAALVSAPPGHSEHHSGYAIDIADAHQAATDLQHAFETTPAYQWLLVNAHHYGFELSFPKNNRQGISFEPWHWRYVLSSRAAQTFAAARSAA
ncbi:MAG: D-alanyl-D-alanine carboxypeptidase family protein [Cyanobacteria bacterium J06648_16]